MLSVLMAYLEQLRIFKRLDFLKEAICTIASMYASESISMLNRIEKLETEVFSGKKNNSNKRTSTAKARSTVKDRSRKQRNARIKRNRPAVRKSKNKVDTTCKK